MGKEYRLQFNDKFLSVEEKYRKDNGAILFGETNNDGRLYILYDSHDSKKIEFFIELIKYVSDLEAKLEQLQKEKELDNSFWKQECDSLQKALAEKEKEIEEITHKNSRLIQGIFWGNGLQFSHEVKKAKTDFAIEQILDIKEKSFGTRETKLVFDIPPVQDVFDNIESKLKELMGDKYE